MRNSYGYQLTFAYGYNYDYDPESPQDQPNFYAWSQSVGISETNLAIASGESTPSQSWATVTVGPDTFFQVTDPMSRVTKYRMIGNSVVGITLPGERVRGHGDRLFRGPGEHGHHAGGHHQLFVERCGRSPAPSPSPTR